MSACRKNPRQSFTFSRMRSCGRNFKGRGNGSRHARARGTILPLASQQNGANMVSAVYSASSAPAIQRTAPAASSARTDADYSNTTNSDNYKTRSSNSSSSNYSNASYNVTAQA